MLSQRAKIKERLGDIEHLLAVGSGKGGVGKSTVAMQLANTYAGQGKRVAVLDCDINGPCQARLGGISDSVLVPTDEGLALPTTDTGVKVLSFAQLFNKNVAVDFESAAKGDSHHWRATKEFSVLAELLTTVIWGELDFLIIDLPPGAERTFQFAEFFGPSLSLVLVTIPNDISREIVNRSIKALQKAPNPILGLIENMAGYYCSDCDEVKPLFPDNKEVVLDLPVLGRIPFDPSHPNLNEIADKIYTELCSGEIRDEVSMC